jgi:aryl carrier-like protein
LNLVALRERCGTAITAAAHYQAMQQRGIEYGPMFQAVEMIWQRSGEALAQLQLPDSLLADADVYQLHPVLLDASFQVVAAARSMAATDERFLPVGIRSLYIHAPLPTRLWAYIRLLAGTEPGAQALEADVLLCDEQGCVLVAVSGLRMKHVADMPAGKAAGQSGTGGVGAESPTDLHPIAVRLAAIWAEVLQFTTIDHHDNFFDLGGDSLMASQIASKAQRGGIAITPQDLFEHPTITQLVAALDRSQETHNA